MKITFGNVFIKLDSVHLKDVALMKFSFVYITNMYLRLPLQIHYWHVFNTGIVPTSYSERMFSWFPVYIYQLRLRLVVALFYINQIYR